MARDRVASLLRLSVQYATARPTPNRDRVRRWVRAAVAVLNAPARSYALTVRFVDEDEARMLNRTYRGKDHATNVLTFSYRVDDAHVEGDVVVCVPVVEVEARRQQKDVMAHGAHLVVHGVLHAAGEDHESPCEAKRMEAIERAVLARFRLADPYAVRKQRLTI